jgi:hypothetical protein
MRIPVTKDLLSGLVYIGFGVLTVSVARNYGIGDAMRIGPGVFPMLVGSLIVIIGLALSARAIYDPASSERVAHWEVRPLFFVLLSVVAFSLLITTWGLVPAVIAVVLISYPAAREATLLELALISLILCAFAVAVFVYGLNIPMKIGPW